MLLVCAQYQLLTQLATAGDMIIRRRSYHLKPIIVLLCICVAHIFVRRQKVSIPGTCLAKPCFQVLDSMHAQPTAKTQRAHARASVCCCDHISPANIIQSGPYVWTVSRRFRFDGRDTVHKNGALDRRLYRQATVPARSLNGCRFYNEPAQPRRCYIVLLCRP